VGSPGLQPVVVGLVEFDALFGLWGFRERVVCRKGEGGFSEVSVVEFEGDCLPFLTVIFEDLAGEGVDEFVGEDMGGSVCGLQGGVDGVVPLAGVVQAFLLEVFEGL